MRSHDTEKLKKMRIYPVIILLVVIMLIVGIAISLIVAAVLDNITNGKVSQGYKWSYGFYDQLNDIDVFDTNAIDDAFCNYSKVLNDVKGITITEGSDVLYTKGEGLSASTQNLIEYAQLDEDYGIENRDYKVYLDGSSDSYIGKIKSKKFAFILESLVETIDLLDSGLDKMTVGGTMNQSVLQQVCYYEFTNNEGIVTYVTMVLHITVHDVLYIVMICLGIVLICFIYFLFVIFMLARFVKNQLRLLKLYYVDKETGGRNWYYFLENASIKMKKYRRNFSNAAIIHIRMEKYRSYCSCYGDDEGRNLVSDFYDVIRRNITRREAFARHEICDFGILLCYENEKRLVDRVQQIIKDMDDQRPGVKLYFKAGIYIIDGEKIDVSEGYNRATIARNKIGELHNENVKFFTQEMKAELLWERKVENEMERALINREYKVYLQPKYSVNNEKLAAAEALVRWEHPTEGLVAPYKFIPIFEKNGFITKLDDYMIAEVSKIQAKWIAEGKKVVPISVNISRAHFSKENLAEHIRRIVDSYRVPHEVIELELTESAFFDDKQTLINIVKRMKNYGFAVSMDDFGAGYSSLNSLKELPIDVVKLDAEFFRGNDEEGKGKVIVSEAIDLAKKLNMRIVAEGIETREQVDFLAEKECDLIQGYYFAKPMPVEEFEAKMAQDGV